MDKEYVHEGGTDAIEEGKEPGGNQSEHTGDGEVGAAEAASGSCGDEVSGQIEAEDASYERIEEKVISQISKEFQAGMSDVGRTVERLCREILMNRKELIRLRSESRRKP